MCFVRLFVTKTKNITSLNMNQWNFTLTDGVHDKMVQKMFYNFLPSQLWLDLGSRIFLFSVEQLK